MNASRPIMAISQPRPETEKASGVSDPEPLLSQFETAVTRDYLRFYRVALRIAKNEYDAEDAVQDGFLAAYQHLSDLRSSNNLRTWIASIVINRARMQYRYKNRFSQSLDAPGEADDQLPAAMALPLPDPSPEDSYLQKELGAKLEKLLSSLPRVLRETFVLRRVHGFDTRETAARLRVTEACVKARLFRAAERLNRFAVGYIARRTRSNRPRPALSRSVSPTTQSKSLGWPADGTQGCWNDSPSVVQQ